MASTAFHNGPDYEQLVRRLLARVAAAAGRGIPIAARWPATKASPAVGPEEDATANRAVLVAIQGLLDRADAEEALRQRNRALNWFEDELADAVQELRADADVTQYDVDLVLGQRLETLRIQPTELNVDVGADTEDTWLHSDQGPLAVVVAALAPQVRLSEKTLWNARAQHGPPLATVGGHYVSSRVVRQVAQEIATRTAPLQGTVALVELQCLDPATRERLSEAAWERLRALFTKPAIYYALLRSEDTPESCEGVRGRLVSMLQDSKLVIGLATAALASFWSSRAANVPDPFRAMLCPEMYHRLFETVHARKAEWAAIFLLSQMQAGQLAEAEGGVSRPQIEELLDHLVTTRVTTDFATSVGVALARAEAAGEV